jgi:membrane-associated protease RseP (regulator of RpoE activity)
MGVAGAIGTFAALFRAAEAGPGAVGRLAGAINVGLGVMNLMPVYPLDGGHIVTSLMEARGASAGARAFFTRLTAAAFAVLVQRAMSADLRRLGRRPDGR